MAEEKNTEEAPKAAPKKRKPAASAVERAKKAAAPKKKKKQPMAAKQMEAAAAKVENEKARASTLKDLTPLAREIRTRMEKADGDEQRAVNHRVAAAIQLSDARKRCAEVGIKFSEWCDERLATENFKIGYEQARKLAAAGDHGDQEAVTLAIADMRAREANRKRKSREKLASEAPKKIGHNSGDTGAKKAPAKPKLDIAREAVNDLGDKAAEELARDIAGEFGQRFVPDNEFKDWNKIKNMDPMQLFEYAFGKLGDKDKEAALEKMADDLGATLEFND